MKALILTNEYPPNVYGGAGVHVENLTRFLAELADVEVRAFGNPEAGTGSLRTAGFAAWQEALKRTDRRLAKALAALSTDLAMAAEPVDAQVVHAHTWYSMMGALWIKILYGIPMVATVHSLEPLRPWKEEQLGRGYHLSCWMERTAFEAADAVIAVSKGTRKEVLDCYDLDPSRVHVVYNGIDPDRYRPADPRPALDRYGIDPGRPYLLFVGRTTRQKGIIHLVRALRHVAKDLDAVLCAGAPDTEEIAREMEQAVEDARSHRGGIHWIREMVPVPELVRLYSGAAMFCSPSIYEPFGIMNLEAMACETPVVSNRVGGIPEVVIDGEIGVLVDVEREPSPSFEPVDPEGYARDLAGAINRLWQDGDLRARMGKAGRKRVEECFSWRAIARETLRIYESLAASTGPAGSGGVTATSALRSTSP